MWWIYGGIVQQKSAMNSVFLACGGIRGGIKGFTGAFYASAIHCFILCLL